MSLTSYRAAPPREIFKPCSNEEGGYRRHTQSCPYLSRQFFAPRLIRMGKSPKLGCLVYERAWAQNIGQEIPTDWFLQDERNYSAF